MSELPPIAITLTADTSKLNNGLKHAAGQVSGFADDSSKKMHGMGLKSGIAMAAVGAGAIVAGAAVLNFAKASVQAAQDSVVSDARLDQVAKTMGLVDGAYAGGTQRLKDYASTLSKQIGVEDESIKAVQAKLLTFKGLATTMNETGGAMDRATAAAYDLASAGFGSAEGNATALGKALQDPIKGITALSRSGVTFTQVEKDKIKALAESNQMGKAQEMVLKAIETQTKGTAAATATASDKMKVSFGELQEKVGTAFLPVLAKLADTLIPIFDKLQGPLGEVAEALGGALTKALDALSPILPVVADAFAKIAGTVGGIFATAVTALIPVLTPMLTLLGELATKIGPILSPLLEKIGALIGALVEAVIPLIEPLTEVIMDILDAAAPILGVVIDALIILVKALTPVFAAVGMLIKPLGELINVVLVAFMPVIQPLLPIITLLASVLGDVLVRAIGLLMTGLGYLIQGWAKLAPFILENVTTPVVRLFLEMVSQVLNAAADMLGWVPGLGDKLREAADAVSGFKDTSTKAIADAAKTIGVEGEKIGKNLVEQGVGMLQDPALATKTKDSAIKIGAEFGNGLVRGIERNAGSVKTASTDLVNTATKAARAAGDIQSPSKVWTQIGSDLIDGLVSGLDLGKGKAADAAKSTIDKMTQTVKDRLDEAKSYFQSISSGITNSLSLDAALTAVTTRSDAVKAAQKDLFDAQAALGAEATQGEKDRIAELQGLYRDAQEAAAKGATDIVGEFVAQADKAKAFSGKLMVLLRAGLNKQSFDEIAAMSTTRGMEVADAFINGNMAENVARVNDAVGSAKVVADEVGKQSAQNFYGAGVRSAINLLKAFIDELGLTGKTRKKLMALMDDLASSMGRNVNMTVNGPSGAAAVIGSAETYTGTIPNAGTPEAEAALAAFIAGPDLIPYGYGPGFRAMGGPVDQNKPYIVGEMGPELFIPRGGSGTILPNDQLKGGNTINVYASTNADAHDISREIAWALKVGI